MAAALRDTPDWLVELATDGYARHALVVEVVCPFCGAGRGELCRRGNPFGRAAVNGCKHGPRWVEAALAAGVDVPAEVVNGARRELRMAIEDYTRRSGGRRSGRNVWHPVPGARILPEDR